MLTIWTRARQHQSTCRRLASVRCLWAIGAPTSTFIYTVVFAAGLAFDARAKVARNRQWEEAFAHLREESDHSCPKKSAEQGEAHIDQPGAHLRLPFWEDLPNGLDWPTVQRTVGMELSQDSIPQHDCAHSSWDDLSLDSKLPGAQRLEWPANTGKDLMLYNLPPQSLWAPDSMRLTAMRKRYTWKKLALKQLSTGVLVHALMRRASLLEPFSPVASVREKLSSQLLQIASFTEYQAICARREMLENIERLQTINVNSSATVIAKAKILVKQPAIPRYFQDTDGDFHGICQQMNAAIKQLFQTHRGDDSKEALGIMKICHNLLVSTAAPDVQTFNLLLSGFKLWQRPILVDDVVGAFYVHKIRPNEITCREILNHYTSESRPEDFSRFVAKMRGTADSLMLADPTIGINEASQGRLVRVSEEKIYQKVHPTPMVFGALIDGVLKFAGFDRALDIYYEMKADGWGLDLQGLTRLLRDCIHRVDWEGGIYLWKEINSIKGTAKKRDMIKAYYHMLGLCSVAGNTIAFNHVLNEVAQRGFDIKKIMKSALKITEQTGEKRDYLTPAWAADNVMIAMSDYVHDRRSSEDEATQEVVITDIDILSRDTLELADAKEQTDSVVQEYTDAKDAWAKWLEHEIGERP